MCRLQTAATKNNKILPCLLKNFKPQQKTFLQRAARRIACFNWRIKSRKRDFQITNYREIRERMLSESDPIKTSVLPQLCREKSYVHCRSIDDECQV